MSYCTYEMQTEEECADLPPNLATLPEELLEQIVRTDLLSAIRLRQCCNEMMGRLMKVHAEAKKRRVQWLPQNTVNGVVSDHGCTLTCTHDRGPEADYRIPWAFGSELPTDGRSSWLVRVQRTGGNNGAVVIGVSDHTGCYGWGLHLYTGMLVRRCRSSCGRYLPGLPPPPGWPDGHNTQVLLDDNGGPVNLDGRADGTLVEVHVDHDHGELGFIINRGEYRCALNHFPSGCRLCLWARLVYEDDRVSLVPGLLGGCGPSRFEL